MIGTYRLLLADWPARLVANGELVVNDAPLPECFFRCDVVLAEPKFILRDVTGHITVVIEEGDELGKVLEVHGSSILCRRPLM
jgi:hypothetical protein